MKGVSERLKPKEIRGTQTWGNEEQRARHIDENKKLDMT
jgi:hypothetical protein